MSSRLRRAGLTFAALVALGAAGCGGNDDEQGSRDDPAGGGRQAADLERDQGLPARAHRAPGTDTGTCAPTPRPTTTSPRCADFDYAKLLADQARERCSERSRSIQDDLTSQANPAYEQMEGVVAGVPVLADYDVIIDAGGDSRDPENAVPFSAQDAGRQDVQAARATSSPDRDRAFGHRAEVRRQGRQARPRRRRQGQRSPRRCRTPTSSSPPRDGLRQVREGARRGPPRQWQPTLQDAFTAVVVMTPTMSEYFEAWKNSRFIAGDDAEEKGFVAASRL